MTVLRAALILLTATAVFAANDGAYGNQPTGGNPMLGISMRPPPTNVLQVNNLRPDEGVYVRQVFDDTAASRMGIQVGDVITHVNGTAINSMQTLRDVISNSAVGAAVNVTVRRNGQDVAMGDSLRKWPENIPQQPIDARAEDEYRKRLQRQRDQQSQSLSSTKTSNQQMAKQLDDNRAATNREMGLDEAQAGHPRAADPGVRPFDLSVLPRSILALPAWKFDYGCAAAVDPAPAAPTATPAETDPRSLLAPRIGISFRARVPGEVL